MKVLIISHMYPSSMQPVFGIFVQEQVKELIKQGCEIKVVAPMKATPFPINKLRAKWRAYDQVPSVEEREGITVYHPRYMSLPKNILFERNGENLYSSIKELVKNIRKEFDFDLIHAHVALPDGFAARKLAEDFEIPFAVTIHGEDFFKSIHLNEKAKEAIRLTMSDAAKVIMVSERLNKINKKELGVPESKISVIHNGINDLFLEPRDSEKAYFPESKINILSVSYLVERKGIEYNLRALSRLKDEHPDFHYVIAGDGEERQSLEQLTKELGLENHVTFLGAVVLEVVKELMDQSDIFCLPSWNEAFGVVYIEAMASENAVIGCLGEGVEEIITPHVDGLLVPSRNEEALAEAFQSLMNQPDLIHELACNAVEKVKEGFTWKKNALKIKDVYHGILNEK